jgi:transcriptional regulator with XRE-family HTH domain
VPKPDNLPSNLKAAREKSALSQQDVAKRLGISKSAVSQWESGTTRPSPENLVGLAELYGLVPGVLEYADPETIAPQNEGRKVILSLPTFDRTPYYRHRLSPVAYERLYGYLERLRQAGYDEEQLETAERIMVDPRYAKLNKTDRRTPTEDDVLTFIDAGWAIVWEIATSSGASVKGPRPHFGRAEDRA